MTLETLKREASESAAWRGHTLGPWQDSGKRSYAECECGAGVQVDTKPPANGINIGGSAVAINCPNTQGTSEPDTGTCEPCGEWLDSRGDCGNGCTVRYEAHS